MENIKKISEEEKVGLKNCSVLNSPNNPSASGYNATQIKQLMVNPIFDGQTNLVDIINGIIDDANAKIEQAFIDNALERESLIDQAVDRAGVNADAKDLVVEQKVKTYTDTKIRDVNNTYELEEEVRNQDIRLDALETKKHAKDISVSLNQTTGVLEIQLIDDDGNPLGEKQSVDFPLEMLIEDSSYNPDTKTICLFFRDKNKYPMYIDIVDLVDVYTGESGWINIQSNIVKIADGIKAKINQAHTHSNMTLLNSLTDVDTVGVEEMQLALAAEQGNPNPITSGAVYTAINTHSSNNSNPHNVTKEQVGLGNVDNTSDLDKPISTATQSALNGKQDTLTAGNGITIENNTISASASGGLQKKTTRMASVIRANSDKLSTKSMLFRNNLSIYGEWQNPFLNPNGVPSGLIQVYLKGARFILNDLDTGTSYVLFGRGVNPFLMPIQIETEKVIDNVDYFYASARMLCAFDNTTNFDITIQMRTQNNILTNLVFLPIRVIKRVLDTSTGIITETQLPNCEMASQYAVDICRIWYE